MKPLVSLALVLLIAGSAAADPIAIDYQATDPSCIDAGRFADEVSAKLGFVPWAANATSTIRVRISHEGAVFTGTVKNVDGSAKIIDGATCAEVTSNLAVTVAAAVDQKPQLALPAQDAAPAPPPAPDDGRIPVTFSSGDGRRVDVLLNGGSGVGVASNGTHVVTNVFAPLCTTPCTARLPRGRHYLRFHDPDQRAMASERLMIDAPAEITMQQRSRRGARIGFVAAGLVLGGISVASYVVPDHQSVGTMALGGFSGVFGVIALVGSVLISDGFTTTMQRN